MQAARRGSARTIGATSRLVVARAGVSLRAPPRRPDRRRAGAEVLATATWARPFSPAQGKGSDDRMQSFKSSNSSSNNDNDSDSARYRRLLRVRARGGKKERRRREQNEGDGMLLSLRQPSILSSSNPLTQPPTHRTARPHGSSPRPAPFQTARMTERPPRAARRSRRASAPSSKRSRCGRRRWRPAWPSRAT